MNSELLREFSTDLSCTACISSGYVYYYGTQSRTDIVDGDSIDGYCCREMADGTLYCGDEMDKIFDKYIDASSEVTQTRVDRVKLSYRSLVDRIDAGAKTKAQDLYLGLFDTSKDFDAGNADEDDMLAAFDDAELQMVTYWSSPTSEEAAQFLLYHERLVTYFPNDGGDITEADDGAEMTAVYIDQDFDAYDEAAFDDIRLHVMMQAILGRTLADKFFTAYEVVESDNDKSALLSSAQNFIEAAMTTTVAIPASGAAYANDHDTIVGVVYRIYYGSDTNYSNASEFEADFAAKDALTGDAATFFHQKLYDGFNDGASPIATNELSDLIRIIPYISDSDGFADYKAYDYYTENETSNVATTEIHAAMEEFLDDSSNGYRFDGLLMFQYLNEIIAGVSGTEGRLQDVIEAYMNAIKSFPLASGLNTSGCDAINRLIFESIDYGNEGSTDFDTKFDTMKTVLELVVKFNEGTFPALFPIEAALSVVGGAKLTMTNNESPFDTAQNIVANPDDILTETGASDGFGAYAYFYPDWLNSLNPGSLSSKVMTNAQCQDIDLTDITTTGANADYIEFIDFLLDRTDTTDNNGNQQEIAESAWYPSIILKLNDIYQMNRLYSITYSAIAMYDGENRFQTQFSRSNLQEQFGITGEAGYYQMSTSELEALDLTASTNDINVFNTMMNEVGLYGAPTRNAYIDVFVPDSLVVVQSPSPVVGKEDTPSDPSGSAITLSNQFTSLYNALSACPNHSDHCGSSVRQVTTSDITLSPQLFKAEQSCHYVVKVAGCAYPSVEIAEDASMVGNWAVNWMEYQDGVAAMDENDEGYLAVDAYTYDYSAESYLNDYSTFGLMKITDEDGNNKIVNAGLHLLQIEQRRLDYISYNDNFAYYEEDVEAYNAAVSTVEGELPGWNDGTLVIGETRGPRDNRETALSKLPPRPAPLEPLGSYMGTQIDGDDANAEFVSGFGMPTTGFFINQPQDYGMYKNFGMIGQDYAQLSFASADPGDGTTCSDKYIAVNVFPAMESAEPNMDPGLVGGQQTYLDQMVLTVSRIEAEAPAVSLSEDQAAMQTPTSTEETPFVLTAGGIKLAASTTLAGLLAFSLY